MRMEVQKIAQITGGRLAPEGSRDAVTGISTDSRTLQSGQLFVPLRGENFDGHDYLLQAVRQGAAACLSEQVVAGLPVPVILVKDTLRALGDLAGAVRRNFSGPVLAVTGSSGKTTTKEMLASILALTGPGLKTEGNFNNLVGLPHTLFRLEPQHHRWAVLEMGMSARGEIARLAEIAAPGVGIITNVGPAHLETLHGLDGVARAKGELFESLPPGGTAVINADDERVAGIPVANGVRRLLFGCAPGAEVGAEEIVAGESVTFRLRLPSGNWPVRLATAGRHNVHNALAAAAAAYAVGIDGETVRRGLEAFRAGRGRMELVRLPGGITLLEDTYNANPLSVRAALVALDEIGGSGRRIAVLGDMLELGREAANFHREVGAEAAVRADELLLLGAMAAETAAGARAGGMAADRVRILPSHAEAIAALRELLRPGDRVLVKGSRGMRMEKVCAGLREADTPANGNH